MIENCDFCEVNKADFGFDMEWDASLCWLCHLRENFSLWFLRNRRLHTNFAQTVRNTIDLLFEQGLIESN